MTQASFRFLSSRCYAPPPPPPPAGYMLEPKIKVRLSHTWYTTVESPTALEFMSEGLATRAYRAIVEL